MSKSHVIVEILKKKFLVKGVGYIIGPNIHKSLMYLSLPLSLCISAVYFYCISFYLNFCFLQLISHLFYKRVLNSDFIKKNYFDISFQIHMIHPS